MKKSLVYSLILLLLFPLGVLAESKPEISSVHVAGSDKKYSVGEEVEVEFSAYFSNLFKDKNTGLAIMIMEIDYDSEVLLPYKIESPYFDTEILETEDHKYYLYSEVIFPVQNNACASGLYCGDYNARVSFYIKKYKETPPVVSIKNIEAYLFDVQNGELREEDIITISKVVNETYKMDVKPSEDYYIEDIKPITKNEELPKIENIPKKNSIKKPTSVESTDNDLKKLEIEGYEINFDKYKHQYTIDIDEAVNNLNITVETNNAKATYKITGADNLKENKNKVEIEVTSESGDTNKYTIFANRQKNVETKETDLKDEKDQIKQINDKMLVYGGITLGVIGLLILIAIITKIHKNKALNKYLDK